MSRHNVYLGDVSENIINNIYENPIEYRDDYYEDTVTAINLREQCISKLIEYVSQYIDKRYRFIVNSAIYRWITTQRLLDRESRDPVIPCINTPNMGFIVWIQQHSSIDNSTAQEVDHNMHIICNGLLEKTKISIDLPLISNINIIDKNKYKEIQSPYYKPLRIESHKYNKLFFNYKSGASKNMNGFKLALWRLLARYDPLMSTGYHAAIPAEVFDVLKNYIKVDCELYASPLNSYLPRYCSLFPDTDCVFGSIGNIVYSNIRNRLFNKGGAFEVNPPFTEEHLAFTTKLIINLLNNIKYSLTFVIIYPHWTDLSAYNILLNSRYNLLRHLPDKAIILGSGEHVYKRGDQHISSDSHVSRSISALFIVQNHGVAISDNVLELIRSKFKYMQDNLDE